jgi:hypothetical protein
MRSLQERPVHTQQNLITYAATSTENIFRNGQK